MQFSTGSITGLVIIEPKVFGDARGHFYESYHKQKFAEAGILEEFVQDNQSLSSKGTVRGLHFQKNPYGQSKLVRVLDGEVYDVAVDLRPTSSTFGQWFGITLSSENKKMMYIPTGFAHGFAVLSETAVFCYKCGSYYKPEHESGIIWNDPELAIDWKVDLATVSLSPKDALLPTFAEIKKEIV